jgi:tetratricopeptide (TPR) repeat protein
MGGPLTLAFIALTVVSSPAILVAAQDQVPRPRPKDAYERAVALEAEGNYPAALALLWEASGLAPRDAEIQNRLGEALERIGALEAAVDAYRRAVSERPAFRKASNNLILALVKVGKGAEAVERAQALVAQAPDDPERTFTLGLAQSEQDAAAAIEAFRRVLQLAPSHALAHYNLALVLRRADRLTEALAALDRVLAIEPRPEVHYTMGTIYLHQGDLDRAARALGAAIAAGPRYADAHYTLGSVLKAKRQWNAAAASLRRAIDLRPDQPAAHYTLAQVLQSAGDDAGARRHLAEAERLRHRAASEQEASVATIVGISKMESGDVLAGLDQFRRATTIFEAYAPAHYQMGLALRRLGKPDASRAAFERARQLNPSLVPPPDRN